MKSMHYSTIALALAVASFAPGAVYAQAVNSPAARQRTQAILASLDKSKHVVKEKRGVRREKYLEVRNAPVIKADPRDYSGLYEVEDLGMGLQLRVDANGRVEGTGYEPMGGDVSVRRSFILRDAKVDGALLTATKVYANGGHEPFEAVFVNRSVFNSPSDPGVTEYGLGAVGKDVQTSGVTFNRFFYRLRR